MDPLGAHWFSKLEEADDDSDVFINQWEMMKSINNLDDIPPPRSAAGSYSSAYPSSSGESVQEISPPQKLETTYDKIISFGDSNSPKSSNLYGRMHNCTTTTTVKTESMTRTTPSAANAMSIGEMMNFSSAKEEVSPSFIFGGCETQPVYKKGCYRTPLQAQDHVLAERKRRERLSERFVALSTMIPGLKKLDKASVLGGAIKYLKQMEERIRLLEEEKEIRKQEELSSSSKRTLIIGSSSSDDQTTSGFSSSDDEYNSSSEILNLDPAPEIEVRISDTNVLVRVYSEKRNGMIKDILGEIEKLRLGIISSSVIPFGTTTLNITVIAQMDREDCMRAQEIADAIRMAIKKIISVM